MAPRNEQPHSRDTQGQRGGGTALTLSNAEAAGLLRSPTFVAAAASLYEVERLWSGKPRNAKSAVFYAALEGLALNIEQGGERTVSFTYGEWATIGNTWPRSRGGKSTTDEGVGAAFRAWKDESLAVKAAPNVFVTLTFRSSKHGGGNTPGQASVSVEFQDAQGRTFASERPDPSRNRAHLALLGYDEVLTSQADAMLAYARGKKLGRCFAWPLPKRGTEYRVLLSPMKVGTRWSRVAKAARAVLPFLLLIPLPLSGWYLKERQTLNDLVSHGPRALLQTEAVCRNGAAAVHVQVVLGVVVRTVHLIRREAGSTGKYDLVRSFHLGTDFTLTAALNADREEPNIRISKAIDYTDTQVHAGRTYEYNLAVQSSFGEMFPFFRGGPPTSVAPCP